MKNLRKRLKGFFIRSTSTDESLPSSSSFWTKRTIASLLISFTILFSYFTFIRNTPFQYSLIFSASIVGIIRVTNRIIINWRYPQK